MATNDSLNIQELVKITAGGLEVAEYNQIRGAIVNRYLETYGSDIDLSTASADGVFVNDLALVINNILQVTAALYQNLDVNQAAGIYLDALCALSNVRRKLATRSNASIELTNTGSAEINVINPQFSDQAGTIWQYDGTLIIPVGQTQTITVFCQTVGSVQAPAGWINQMIEYSTVTVDQTAEANVGLDNESDAALRARRNQSISAAGITVLESLIGALLKISGIEDVKIYNNNTGTATTAKDTTTVDAHSIYVILRKTAGVNIADSVIGSIIHDKLTPGIHSCDMASGITSGVGKSYEYVTQIFGVSIAESAQMVYWKEAVGVAPTISITFTPNKYFTTSEFDGIAFNLMQYLNGLSLSTNLTTTDLLIRAINADPKFRGNATYNVGTITINSGSSYTNPDTFYNYNHYSYSQSGTNYVLTLNKQ